MKILSKVISTTLSQLDINIVPFFITNEVMYELGVDKYRDWSFKFHPNTEAERWYTHLDTHFDIDDLEIDLLAGSFPSRIIHRYSHNQSLEDWIPESRFVSWLDAYLDYTVTIKQICDLMSKMGDAEDELKYDFVTHGHITLTFKRTSPGKFQNIFRPDPLTNILTSYDVDKGSSYPRAIADWFRLNPELGHEIVLDVRRQFLLLEGISVEDYRAPKAMRAIAELFKNENPLTTQEQVFAPRMTSVHRGITYSCGVGRPGSESLIYICSDQKDLWTFDLATSEWTYPNHTILPSDYLFIQNMVYVCFSHYLHRPETNSIKRIPLTTAFNKFIITPTKGQH